MDNEYGNNMLLNQSFHASPADSCRILIELMLDYTTYEKICFPVHIVILSVVEESPPSLTIEATYSL